MKKMFKAGICIAAAVMVISGCGKSTDTKETTTAAQTTTKSAAELTDEASITLGQYKDLELTRVKAAVTDEEMDEQLNYIMSKYPNPKAEEVTGRPAQEGDTAVIDYVGTKDGVAFEGGTADGYELVLGSHSFIDGFEEGVVGMEIGEEKEINLTFPSPYERNPDLAGKPVVFKVKLNGLKIAEETVLDDALAKRAMGDESATLETMKSQLYGNIMQQKERDAFYEAGNQALQQIIENSEITCDPDAVEAMYQDLTNTYTSYASQYGMDLESFLGLFLGTDLEGLKGNAENLVKQQMVLDELIKVENITATDEQKENLAQINNFASADLLVQTYGEESSDRLFSMEAAYHFLIDNSNVTMVDAADAAQTGGNAETADGEDESSSQEESGEAGESAAEEDTEAAETAAK